MYGKELKCMFVQSDLYQFSSIFKISPSENKYLKF